MAFGFGFGMPRILTAPFTPAALFLGGQQGAWYDPSDVNLNWRYNLLTYTEQFDNAAWTKSNSTITANATIAPDNTTTAEKLVENTANNFHYVIQNVGTISNTETFSFFAKVGERAWCASQLGSAALAYYDLQNGVVGTQLNCTASILPAGNGWFLCSITATRAGNTGNLLYVATANNTASYTGDGTSGIFIWGAQLQTGSVATTYQQIVTPEISYLNYQPQPVLFQDSAGTTPVTAVQQPVGLMLDKSKGLVLVGPELVTNGDFNSGTTGWSSLSSATLAVASGELQVTSTGLSFAGAQETISCVVGKTYRISFVGRRGTSVQGVAAAIQSVVSTQFNATTQNVSGTLVFTATSTSHVLQIYINGSSASGETAFFDNISVKELPGNHAFQTTSASRPVLSARYNLLTKTEQFDDAVWVIGAANVTANAAVAPNGTTTADLINLQSIILPRQSATFTNATAYSFSVFAKASTASSVTFYINGLISGEDQNIVFNLANQTISKISGTGDATITSEGNGWYKLTYSRAANQTASGYFAISNCSGVLLWGADLRVSNDALGQPAYQRVNTATDYDTVGFKPYLAFDGVDDSLVTNSIDFTSTDKMTVFAGVRKLSDATQGFLAELSANSFTNNGTFNLIAPAQNTIADYGFRSKGTIAQDVLSSSSYAAPITNVLTGIGNISGDQAILRVNGTQAASNTADQGTGNYGNYPLFIGRRNQATLPFNGRLYSLIVRGAASTTAQITSTEAWVNQRTGAYT